MQLIDTHVHINFDVFQSDIQAVRDRWRSAGVTRLIHSCVTPAEFASIQSLANRFPELYFAVGLHPLDDEEWQRDSQDRIRSLANSDPKVVAVGEMGLYFYKAENRDTQKLVFESQLQIAQELDKPAIIHCRDAAADMAGLLQDFWDRFGTVKGVMHCWSGTPEETQLFLDLGFYISLSGIVTFKTASAVKESAKMIPEDRLLIETDCPFLAPVPKRGKRNEPAYVQYVAAEVAKLRNLSVETLADQTTNNACRLFGLGSK